MVCHFVAVASFDSITRDRINVCMQLTRRLPLWPMALRSNNGRTPGGLSLNLGEFTTVGRLWIAKMRMMTQQSFIASPYCWRIMGPTKASMFQICQWTFKCVNRIQTQVNSNTQQKYWLLFKTKCGLCWNLPSAFLISELSIIFPNFSLNMDYIFRGRI